MSSPRLRIQFETLFEHYGGEDSDVQLEDITEVLFCTRRNARIVLNKLAEEGWIEWHPAAGRGKLSRLNFLRNKQDVSENLAKRYLEEGKIGQALNVLERDPGRLTQVIQDYLGLQHQQGQQVIRLPYYRPLANLNPHKPTRRSEKHIIRQVFNGLTKLDENDHIQGDLAYEWEMLDPCHWRFYLRAGVRCHNGNLLQPEQIIASLRRSAESPLLAHMAEFSLPFTGVLDIHLTQPDYHLPLLLSETNARIVPNPDVSGDSADLTPVGTGPFKVVSNDDKRLVLEAFDQYFGYRPLLDKVEVWVVDEAFSTLVYPSLQPPVHHTAHTPVEDHQDDLVELDPGCTYMLLNQRTGLAADPRWADYFASTLSSFAIFERLPKEQIGELGLLHAHGLKPGWFHTTPAQRRLLPPGKETIHIAYHCYHPGFKLQSKAVEALLNEDGLEVKYIRYDVDLPEDEQVDIWLKPMGLSSNREDGLAGWMLGYGDIERMSKPEQFEKWRSMIDGWRAEPNMPFPGKQLGRSLVEAKQLIPMFHCWLGLSKDHCGSLQNAKANALGWFDFHRVWVRPER